MWESWQVACIAFGAFGLGFGAAAWLMTWR